MTGLGEALFDERCNSNANEYAVRGGGWGKKAFPYRKVEGLFYYICVRKRITRDEAIGIFWVDCDETSARKNLRDALYHIKKIVGPDIISMDGNVFISLNPEHRY